jgi:hypothetical protein
LTGHHLCVDLKGGESATTGSPVVLNSCKDMDDNQSWHYDPTYNTFTVPMDAEEDDENLEDVCMGLKRSYDEKLKPGKFEVVGVNCYGDSFVEGDVFWTMPPKYELAY